MKDSINVYWTSDLNTTAAAANQKPPRPVKLSEWKGESFMYCPSLRDHCKNVFAVDSRVSINPILHHSTMDFWMSEKQEHLGSYCPQGYGFEGDTRKRYAFSLQHLIYLTTDCNDLDIEIVHPFMTHSTYSNQCEVVPGQFNLGKYSRSISLSFQLRDSNIETLDIKEGDALYYIRFKTDKKINFIPFYPEEHIMDLFNNTNNSSVLGSSTLGKHYDNYKRFNTKKVLLKRIRNQLNEG